MDERSRKPARRGVGARRSPDTPTPLHSILRLNQGPQTTTDERPIWVLATRFLAETGFATTATPVFVTGVSLNSGGGPRLHVLISSKLGRYIHTWQSRKKLGDFRVTRIPPDDVAFSYLRAYLGKSDKLCDATHSIRLILRFVEMLGETPEADGAA